MVQFDLFSSQAEQNYITLSAEQLVMFDSADEEIYPIGTPQIWDDYIIQKIPLEDFDVFHIYAHIIPKSLCSRITDYKKIWGLREIPRGIADNSCEIGSQKIYWGISRSHGRVGFESRYSSMLVLVPGNIECQPYCILDAFVKRGTDFISQNIMPIFSEICKDIPSAMILILNTNKR